MNLVAQGTVRLHTRTWVPVLSILGGQCLQACESLGKVVIWLTNRWHGFCTLTCVPVWLGERAGIALGGGQGVPDVRWSGLCVSPLGVCGPVSFQTQLRLSNSFGFYLFTRVFSEPGATAKGFMVSSSFGASAFMAAVCAREVLFGEMISLPSGWLMDAR